MSETVNPLYTVQPLTVSLLLGGDVV